MAKVRLFPSPPTTRYGTKDGRSLKIKKPSGKLSEWLIVYAKRLILLAAQHHQVVHVNLRDVTLLTFVGFVIAVYEFALYGNLLTLL